MKKIKSIKKFNTIKWQREMIYNSWWLHKFINKFMQSGKKTIIEKNMYNVLSYLNIMFGTKLNVEPVNIVYDALEKLKPLMDCTFIRRGKQTNRNKTAEIVERNNPYTLATKLEVFTKKSKKKKWKNVRQIRAVPFPLKPRRQYIIALKWWVNAIKRRSEKTFENRLLLEFAQFTIYNETTASVEFNNLVHLVVKNRNYANYRWH